MSGLRSQKGFTLMEVIVVMIIVSIMVGIAMVSIGPTQRRTMLKEAARAIEGDFMEIRGTARSRQQSVLVAITSPTTYTACIDAFPQDGVCTAADTLVLTRTLARGAQLQAVAPLVIPGTFSYNSLGALNAVTQIIVNLPDEPNRQYCVRLFPTGISRVEWIESGAPPPCGVAPWTRAW